MVLTDDCERKMGVVFTALHLTNSKAYANRKRSRFLRRVYDFDETYHIFCNKIDCSVFKFKTLSVTILL